MQRHSLVYTAALIAVFSFAAPAPAQILPGHSIATVIAGTGTARTGEIYDIDHQTGKATQLRTPAIFNTEWPNTILMANPVSGWVGTNSPGNIYSISVTGGNVTAKKLNTNATAGNNVAQMVLVGSTLYFTTQTAGVIGTLYSMPSGGGAVTQVLDLSKAGGVRIANAVAAIGTTVFVGTFTSSPAPNNVAELIAYDTVKKTGSKHMDIPAGVWQTGWGMGVVSMHQVPIRPRNLALFGVYGDYFEIDVVSKKVVVKEFTGPHLGNGGNNAVNSAAWDPVGQDWIMGTRDGFVDRWVDGQCAEKIIPGVGTATTATQNSVTGMHHFPASAGVDYSIGKGCAGPGGFTATDVSMGAPVPGNSKFALGLYSAAGGDRYLLSMGLQPLTPPFDLGVAGAAGCKLFVKEVFVLVGGVTGTGNGLGKVVIPAPIPTTVPKGTKVYRQWLLGNKAPVNGAQFTVSNARLVEIK
ncbi:MAG: hypothetical protein ACYTGW_20165 [Planctomycetota bacterium]|jgi:hypothetical protein